MNKNDVRSALLALLLPFFKVAKAVTHLTIQTVILFFLLIILIPNAKGQNTPVVFDLHVNRIQDHLYQLDIVATINPKWHLYAKSLANKIDGPMVQLDNETAKIKVLTVPKFVKENDVLFGKASSVFVGSASFSYTINILGNVPGTLRGKITAFAGKGDNFLPIEQTFELLLEGGIIVKHASLRLSSIDIKAPLSDCGILNKRKESSLWATFWLGVVGGLIALLTPCVFPIIPLTVSFFTGRSATKRQGVVNGFWYGFFIILIYVLASVPFHLLGRVQPEVFNNIATNPILNLIFFLVFVGFAISLFGYVSINLPSAMVNKADAKGSLGSIWGIFFMALTLAIVSFSCTGPILGSLLVSSLSHGAWPLTSGLAGFGFALALPFALFAIFPNWLHALPRSGGWLDTVKKVLAFVELALAFKFLSNADLVLHWGVLKREVFFAIWIAISLALSAYLFGLYRLPHELKMKRLGLGRKVLAVFILLFAAYLFPGVTKSAYANVRLLSGFPPPLSYSIYGKANIEGKGLEPDVINDYDKAIKMSREQHKALLIDFTGWACVNCRKMEEQVWTRPEISEYIKAHFILVSLYVDDKQKLPVNQRISNYKTKDGNIKEISTLGDKWATFQAENTGQVTQPLYLILNDKEQLVNPPVGYTPAVEDYKKWLMCGTEHQYNK